MIGRKFGRWTVIGPMVRGTNSDKSYPCQCECGTVRNVLEYNLRSGDSKSCGCLHKEIASLANVKHGEARRSGRTPEFAAYVAMIRRCSDTSQNFKDYAGRGIKVCDEWLNSFEAFLAHVGRKPTRAHTLDRIDNNGNYEPGNVRWATRKEQANNKRYGNQYSRVSDGPLQIATEGQVA